MAIWLAIGLICFLFSKELRHLLQEVLSSLFSPQMLEIMLAMLLWVGLEVLGLCALRFWDLSFLKDTIFWIFGIAFVYLMKTGNSRRDEHYFSNAFTDNLKATALLEFVINFCNFNFLTEFILLPVVVLIGSISIVVQPDGKNMSAKKMADSILFLFGMFLIGSAIVSIVRDYRGFFNMENLHSLLLPIVLTLLYFPFLYGLELYASYENLGRVRLYVCRKSSPSLATYAWRKVFLLCLLRLERLNKFMKDEDVSTALMNLKSRDDVVRMIREARKRGL